MKEKCNSYLVQGDEVRKLKEKLKHLKYDLKIWNYEVFGLMKTSKKIIVREIEELDAKDGIRELEDILKLKKMEIVSQLRVVQKKTESLLC